MAKPTRLSSFYDTLVRYKHAHKEASQLWAQVTTIFPNLTYLEVDLFLKGYKVQKAVPKPVPKKTTPKKPVPKKAISKKSQSQAIKDSKAELSSKISKSRKAVASGDLPPLRERLRIVLGDDTLVVKDAIAALTARGWMPESKDPSTYISFMLSSSKEDFERISRGRYRVIRTKAPQPKAKKLEKPSSTTTPRQERDRLYRWCLSHKQYKQYFSTETIHTLKAASPSHLARAWESYHKLNQANRKKEIEAALLAEHKKLLLKGARLKPGSS